MPAVSVILPAFNAATTLPSALDALTHQSLDDLEIIVVDDGSTDETLAIARAVDDPRVVVLTGPNRGVSAARNRGIERAIGAFIGFVDADDSPRPTLFEALLNSARRHEADVSFCDVEQVSEDGEARVRDNTLALPPERCLSLRSHPQMVLEGWTTVWNRLYRRAFLDQHGLRLDEDFRISEDMLFLQQVLCHAGCVVRVPESLYRYRVGTPGSLTSYAVRNRLYEMNLAATIELVDFWVRQDRLAELGPLVLTKACRNLLWNTHIDTPHLEHVFAGLAAYLGAQEIDPAWAEAMPKLEAKVLRSLLAARFGRFMRVTKGYRQRMIASKGGTPATGWGRLAELGPLLRP